MPNEITDEMVKTALDATYSGWASEAGMRAALEAIAPSLRAQGMRDAIQELDDVEDGTSYPPRLWARRRAVLAKAAELEQGK